MITSGRKSFKNPFRYSLKRALSYVRVSGRVVRGLYGRERKGSSGESSGRVRTWISQFRELRLQAIS